MVPEPPPPAFTSARHPQSARAAPWRPKRFARSAGFAGRPAPVSKNRVRAGQPGVSQPLQAAQGFRFNGLQWLAGKAGSLHCVWPRIAMQSIFRGASMPPRGCGRACLAWYSFSSARRIRSVGVRMHIAQRGRDAQADGHLELLVLVLERVGFHEPAQRSARTTAPSCVVSGRTTANSSPP